MSFLNNLIAKEILERMDLSVDPCEDFYQFSCGSFVRTKRVSKNQNYLDRLKILEAQTNQVIMQLLTEPVGRQDINATIKAKNFYV